MTNPLTTDGLVDRSNGDTPVCHGCGNPRRWAVFHDGEYWYCESCWRVPAIRYAAAVVARPNGIDLAHYGHAEALLRAPAPTSLVGPLMTDRGAAVLR